MGIFERNTDIEQTPKLSTVLNGAVIREIEDGRLPVIRTDKIQLNDQEQCHYVDQAIYEKKIRIPRSAKRQSRGLFRARQSDKADARSGSVVDIEFRQVRGYLYITDTRVMFRSPFENWERPLHTLLGVKPYLNCVKMQFGKDSYKVFVPDGSLAHSVLALIRPLV